MKDPVPFLPRLRCPKCKNTKPPSLSIATQVYWSYPQWRLEASNVVVAAESGEVAVFAEGRHGVRKLGQARLAPFAHTVAVDSQTHLVYFPLQSGSAGRPQLLVMAPR